MDISNLPTELQSLIWNQPCSTQDEFELLRNILQLRLVSRRWRDCVRQLHVRVFIKQWLPKIMELFPNTKALVIAAKLNNPPVELASLSYLRELSLNLFPNPIDESFVWLSRIRDLALHITATRLFDVLQDCSAVETLKLTLAPPSIPLQPVSLTFGHLHRVEFDNSHLLQAQCCEFLQLFFPHLSNIRTLVIGRSFLSIETCDLLQEISAHMTSLTELSMDRHLSEEERLSEGKHIRSIDILEVLRPLKSLTWIDFGLLPLETSQLTVLQSWPRLVELPSNSVSLEDATLSDLEKLFPLQYLRELPSLPKRLQTDDTVNQILLNFPKLRVLSLHGSALTDDSLVNISSLLSDHLEELLLSHLRVSSERSIAAIATLGRTLRVLELRSCPNLPLTAFAYLSALRSLRRLNLAHTRVNSETFNALSSLINIQSLSLNYTAVSDLLPLASLSYLRELSLLGCNRLTVVGLRPLTSLQRLLRLSISGISSAGWALCSETKGTRWSAELESQLIGPCLLQLTQLQFLELQNVNWTEWLLQKLSQLVVDFRRIK